MKNDFIDKNAETDEAIFLEAAARLKLATDAESIYRDSAIQDLAFEAGDQWDTDIANSRKIDKRPALTINHTHTYVTRVINTLKQQRPRIKCHPTGDGARIEDAQTVNGLIRHIESLSNASVAYDLGGTSAVKIGWGYWRIMGEYCDEKSFDQELKIKPVRNTFTGYDDPSAVMPAGEDRMWFIFTEKMKRIEYKRLYPNADNCEWQADGQGDQGLDWENKEEIRLAEYYRIVEKPDTLYQLQDGTPMLKSEFEAHERVMPGMLQLRLVGGKQISRPTTRRQVKWYRLNGKKIVDRRQLPGRFIPVIKCIGDVQDLDGKVTYSGMIRNLKDPARMYNYWRTSETERYALAPKAPWVMAEGQADGHPEWDQANQRSFSRLVYKPVTGPDGVSVLPAPQRQPPVPVEAGMAQAAAGAEHDLASVAGLMPENPEDRKAVVSGNKYLQRRQGMADLVHWHYYDNQTYSIMMTGVILLDLIPWYYDMPRMQRIIGEDGVPQMVGINQAQETSPGVMEVKNNLTLGKYDVIMDTGPGYQTKREESAETLINLLGTPMAEPIVKNGADLVLRNIDVSGAEELADRLLPTNPEGLKKVMEGLPKQAQTIIQAMQQQVTAAQQENNQLKLELKYKGGIEKMKDEGQTRRTLITTTGAAHDTERTAESDDLNSKRDYEGWMRDVDVRSRTAKDVAEINAAAKIITTKQNNEHDARQAKELVKAGTEDR